MEIEISKVKKEEDQEVLSCSFLGKSIPSHLPGFVFMVSGLQLSDAVLQTVEKSGDPAGAVSGVADLCGISEFHGSSGCRQGTGGRPFFLKTFPHPGSLIGRSTVSRPGKVSSGIAESAALRFIYGSRGCRSFGIYHISFLCFHLRIPS